MWDATAVLRRQALVVALVCVVCDSGGVMLTCPLTLISWTGWVMWGAAVLVDCALATPTRWSGAVAVAHALVQGAGPWVNINFASANAVGLLIAGYRAGAWLGARQGVGALVVIAAGIVAARLPYLSDWRLIAINVLDTGLLPWLVGRHTTARRGYLAELEQREARRRAEEREVVRQAVAKERSTIARDLHDVISHHVSAINVHAGAARLALNHSPEDRVRTSLTAVETASRSAMTNLRSLLDLLHHGDDGTVRQPGLDDLDDLVALTRAAGLPTHLITAGSTVTIPRSVDIALYRIVQEALTNALTHGGGRQAVIELDRGKSALTLTVVNDLGADRPVEVRHRGLAGIRHRAALINATVECGPVGADWVVRVTVPLDGQEN